MKKLIAVISVSTFLIGGFFLTDSFSTHAMEVEPSVLSVQAPEF